ncbi:hypothetical protein OG871_11175 [Kitasatospora sp. NBC_00374]|uniref:hypothetical protein n=1 Tax=Kitasatospora sp. NBC_00374 TaxID=2975964 RepID=UPI0032432FF3
MLSGSRRSCAAYLRCVPFDTWEMPVHRHAMETWARDLGLADPVWFIDNGEASHGPKPRLLELLSAVERNTFSVVLVPGPFVFHLDDTRAAKVCHRLSVLGASVLQLPQERTGRQPVPARPDAADAPPVPLRRVPATRAHYGGIG